MAEILQAKYTDFTNEDTDYPSVVSIKNIGVMPVPKPTHSSELLLEVRRKAAEDDEKVKSKHFVMKKFQNVKSGFQREREAHTENIENSLRRSRNSGFRESLEEGKDVY